VAAKGATRTNVRARMIYLMMEQQQLSFFSLKKKKSAT
jgi:hypothetical protein